MPRSNPSPAERAISRRTFLAAAGAGAAGVACATSHRQREHPRAVTVPLVYDERGGLFIEARIGGSDPVRLILDTGASRSTISTEFASKLGLALGRGGEIEGSAGVVETSQAIADVEVPGLGVQSIDLAVYGFGSYDSACVGILGYEFLSRAPFRIRYRDRALEWRATSRHRTVPLTLDGRIPRVSVHINGRPTELRIDTGATFPPGDDAYLNVTVDQAQTLGLTGKPVAVFTATGTGDAMLELPVHALKSLEVGDVRLPRAFAIVQPRVGYFARADAVGFLGNSVLDKLDPYFDYAAATFGVEG